MDEPRDVSRGDAEQVLGTAIDATLRREDHLTVDELKAVGAEVGVPGVAIDEALGALSAQRAAERQADEIRRARRRGALVTAVKVALALVAACTVALAVALVAAVCVSVSTTRALEADMARVAEQGAHVREARARQVRVQALAPFLAPGSARDAELLGAQNRVSVARRRYDAAVAAYNRDSRRWLPFRSFAQYPARYAFSSEVSP